MVGRFACLTLLLAAPAVAQEVPDVDFDKATVVGVQPVLVSGVSPEAAWADVTGFLATPGAGRVAVAPKQLPNLQGHDEGFGFAGKAGASDIRILRHAVLTGMLAGLVARNETVGAQLRTQLVESADGVYAPLSADARAAVSKLVTSLTAGKFEPGLAAAVLRAAEAGIAEGPQRAHGYLAAGLWAGLSTLAAGVQGDRSAFVSMSSPLAVLLREDAAFGGSDTTIAHQIEQIARNLKHETPDVQVILGLLDALLKVEADK